VLLRYSVRYRIRTYSSMRNTVIPPRMIKDPTGDVNCMERGRECIRKWWVEAQVNVCGKYARLQNAQIKGRGSARGMTGDGDGSTSPPSGELEGRRAARGLSACATTCPAIRLLQAVFGERTSRVCAKSLQAPSPGAWLGWRAWRTRRRHHLPAALLAPEALALCLAPHGSDAERHRADHQQDAE
jgi:hypothetical protein